MKFKIKTVKSKFISKGSVEPFLLLEISKGKARRFVAVCNSNLIGGCFCRFENEFEQWHSLFNEGSVWFDVANKQYQAKGIYAGDE